MKAVERFNDDENEGDVNGNGGKDDNDDDYQNLYRTSS